MRHSIVTTGLVTALALLAIDPSTVHAIDAMDGPVLRFEERQRLAPPRHGPDRRALDQALDRARTRSLLDAKGAADRLAARSHDTVLRWPLREAVNYPNPTVQAISNFLDQDPAEEQLEDWNCGGEAARTYDGHKGLDIFLSPFPWYQMERDAGIVVAAAPGIIRDKVGGEPERSCSIEDPAGDNNLVVIEHADGSLAIYAHMRTNSLTARPIGARVEAGEYLGVVGSAGNSTGPHLHFEVGFWENGSWVPQDPWEGACNDINAEGWWAEQPAYFLPAIMAVATHSAQPEQPPCPTAANPHFSDDFEAGDTLYLSFTLRDLRRGDRAEVELLDPSGSVYTATNYTEESWDHAASVFISFSLTLPSAGVPAGDWSFRVRFAGEERTHGFRIDTAPPEPAVLPASNNAWNGLWWDPAQSGEGYNVITTPNGTAIYYYGSDAFGRRLWLVSELVTEPFVAGREYRIAMYDSSGGAWDAPVPSGRGLSPWGELRLGFSTCDAGMARLIGGDGDKLSNLARKAGVPGATCVDGPAVAAAPWSGLWYDPALTGEGFNLVVLSAGSVLYYYGFDADGDRLWLVTAPFDFDYGVGETISVVLYRSTAGTFANPVADALVPWGTLTIDGLSCDRMDYRLETAEGSKVMNARRLVGVTGLDC